MTRISGNEAEKRIQQFNEMKQQREAAGEKVIHDDEEVVDIINCHISGTNADGKPFLVLREDGSVKELRLIGWELYGPFVGISDEVSSREMPSKKIARLEAEIEELKTQIRNFR